MLLGLCLSALDLIELITGFLISTFLFYLCAEKPVFLHKLLFFYGRIFRSFYVVELSHMLYFFPSFLLEKIERRVEF